MSAQEETDRSVPIGVHIAAAWAWRLIVLAAATYLLFRLVTFFSEVTIPLAVALLGTALTVGAVDWLQRRGVPRLLATFGVTLFMLASFFGLIALIGQQLSTQFDDLRVKVVEGISKVQDWTQTGPLNLSDRQLDRYVTQVQDAISGAGQASAVEGLTAVGATLTHFVAGFFIALFAAFFFLYEGDRIWAFVVTLFPRAVRGKVHSSGEQAWSSLTSFVRATVVVALVDAVFIGLAAWLLGVPLALAIGVLVFLGAFVPIVGAFASGLVAVLVALVAQGPFTALLLLIAVIVVQQLESHVLQPFLLGHFVAVHPLAIILAIASGITVGGIVGALVAVPLVACANGVIRHLADEAGAPIQVDGLPEKPPPDATADAGAGAGAEPEPA